MAIKDNIRRRRQERIASILNKSERMPLADLADKKSEHGALGLNNDLNNADRLDDPEYVWKMKQQQWRRELEHSGDGDDDKSEASILHYMSSRQLRNQFACALLVFILILGMFQLDHPWAQKGQAFIDRALNEPFEYEAIAQWYHQFFQGTPSFIPAFERDADAEKVNAFD